MSKPILFLSHSERDKDLAAALKAAFSSSLGIAPRAVFVSSDDSIRAGQQVFPAITSALCQAQAVVVLLTPSSLRAPWVHFEAGGAAVSEKVFVVSGCGLVPSSLPSDLIVYSVKDLRRAPVVRQFLRDIASNLKIRFRRPSGKAILRITRLANTGQSGWELVEPALVARQIDGSPFELLKLLDGASRSVFLIGQNLWSLTRGPQGPATKKKLFEFLARRGTTARILVQELGPGVDAWNSLNPEFGEDRTASVTVLRRWLTEALRHGINTSRRLRLEIKAAPLVPVSYDIVDAELSSGLMVFRHTLHRAPRSNDRPVFALQGGAANPVFRHYLGCWNRAFRDAHGLEPGLSSNTRLRGTTKFPRKS